MSRLEKFFVNSSVYNYVYAKTLLARWQQFVGGAIHDKVLEIGCGRGKTSLFLKKQYPTITLTSLDYDYAQIELAKQIPQDAANDAANSITFVQGDATRLSFRSASFDTVVQIMAFHHISNYKDAMKETARVLKKGGTFAMLDLGTPFFNRLVHFFFTPEAVFTKEEMLDEVQKAGFIIEKEQGRRILFIVAKKK